MGLDIIHSAMYNKDMKGCRPLTDLEVKRVAASFKGGHSKRDRAMFLLGVRSGFRISEILSLRIADFMHGGQIADRVSVSRRFMKGKTEGRSVALHPEVRAALGAWVADLRKSGPLALDAFVFQSRKGDNRPISRVQAWRLLHARFEALGMSGKLGTHSLRKTFAAGVYSRLCFDLVRTRAAMGHRSIASTVAYLSFRESDVDAAVLAA